ncbi:MAG: YkgJ family cysteine cluster protein [Candidatus Omnitrophica bacterium]|nr:YkgJ family cysteine cluster protein [Candidatus Omnitrophota bacterium]
MKNASSKQLDQNFPSHVHEKISKIMDVWRSKDQKVCSFAKTASIQCLPGCGRCCESPFVETSALEMLPVVEQIIADNQVDYWINRYGSRSNKGTCLFYEPDDMVPGNGRCLKYAYRPLICRLYGFVYRRNKNNIKNIITCKEIKRGLPDSVVSLSDTSKLYPKAVNIHESIMEIKSIDPHLSRQQIPINQAFLSALNYLGLFLQIKR